MYKILYAKEQDGKVTLTREELEELLADAYREGKNDGMRWEPPKLPVYTPDYYIPGWQYRPSTTEPYDYSYSTTAVPQDPMRAGTSNKTEVDYC